MTRPLCREACWPLRIYAWAHRLPQSLALLTVAGVLLVVFGNDSVNLPSLVGASVVSTPVPTFVPVVLACLVALSTGDQMADFAVTAARPQWQLRLLHAVGAILLVLMITAMALILGSAGSELAGAVRSVLGFTGAGLMSSVVFGARLGWLLPLLVTVPGFMLARDATTGAVWWTWPQAAPGDDRSWYVATGLLAAGLAFYIGRGNRWRAFARED